MMNEERRAELIAEFNAAGIFDVTDEMLAEFEDGRGDDEDEQEQEQNAAESSGLSVRTAKKVNASGSVVESKLSTYRNLAMSKCNARTEKISKIIIHHMSGRMLGKQCADYFCITKRTVSSNYCIGYEGDIATNIPENYRAWTSSSRWADQRAITIEVSNNSGAPNWTISEASMQALINLCADICKRYDIKSLWYDGTTNGTLLRHCQFANTDCPGAYIKQKTGYICDAVNRLTTGGVIDAGDTDNGTNKQPQPQSQNQSNNQTSPALTAGTELQLKSVRLYKSSTATSSSGTKTGTFYVWSGATAKNRIRITNAKSRVGVDGQVTGWISVSDAKAAAGAGKSAVPAYVAVINCTVLNVRKGPGTGYAIVTQVRKGDAFTIVETQHGWGRLKSGAGWIYLAYTRRK